MHAEICHALRINRFGYHAHHLRIAPTKLVSVEVLGVQNQNGGTGRGRLDGDSGFSGVWHFASFKNVLLAQKRVAFEFRTIT